MLMARKYTLPFVKMPATSLMRKVKMMLQAIDVTTHTVNIEKCSYTLAVHPKQTAVYFVVYSGTLILKTSSLIKIMELAKKGFAVVIVWNSEMLVFNSLPREYETALNATLPAVENGLADRVLLMLRRTRK